MKKAFTAIAIMTALAATAQVANKSLVVTLKDGSTARYNLSEIEHVTFGEPVIPMGEPTTGPYAVGDYWCDGTDQGVVVTVDSKGQYGTIAAMADFSDPLAWSTEWEITDALDLENGLVNMATVAAIDPTYEKYPAFKACASLGEGWYLPAQRELQNARKVVETLNATLTAHGGIGFDITQLYWSSSEADQYMDATAYAADMDFPGMFGITKTNLLPVRAFREFGEKPVPKYTLGGLYDQDGLTGIVYWISEDGENARIVSLTEQTTPWGTVGTLACASSDFDGEANLKAALKADGTLAAFPAFKACTEQGAGWYLPSQKELYTVLSYARDLNTYFKANGGTEITSGYYWSSTEYAADAENSAYALSASDGSSLASSKGAQRRVRAIAYVGPRSVEEPTYAVGDIYYEADQPVGVVFKVSDDGHHGLIAALKDVAETGRINAMWDTRANSDNYVLLDLSDKEDGEKNLTKALEGDPELASLTALRLATEYGSGWYIGAVNEMLALYAAVSDVNTSLKAINDAGTSASSIDTKGEYWSSTEGSDDPTVRVTSVSFKNGSTFDYRKYSYMKVRPIRKF